MRIFFIFLLFTCQVSYADLPTYVEQALVRSDSALNLEDSLLNAEFDLAAATHRYATRIVPLANIGAGSGRDNQGIGVELRRSTELGSELSVGLRAERTASDSYVVSNSHSASAYVRLSQGLLRRWGRKYNRAGLTRSELQQQQQVLQNERVKQDLMLSAVQRYYDVHLAYHLLSTRQQALVRSQHHLTASESRQAVGLVSKVDVYRARLAALNAENAMHDQRRSFRRAVEGFYDLLRLAAPTDGRSEWLVLPDDHCLAQAAEGCKTTAKIERLTPLIDDEWESELLNVRTDWLAHQIDFQLAELALYQAQRHLQPDLALNFSLQRKATGSAFSDLSHLEDLDWAIYLELRSDLELFNEKQALARERLRMNRLQRDSETLERRIRREARESFEDLQAEGRRQTLAEQRFEQAEKALELAQIRYQRGLSDNLDLLDAESALADAELDQLRNQVAYNLSAVRLAHAQGILSLAWLRASVAAP